MLAVTSSLCTRLGPHVTLAAYFRMYQGIGMGRSISERMQFARWHDVIWIEELEKWVGSWG